MDKDKIQDTHVYFPETLYQRVVIKADEERRSVNSQIIVLVEKGLSCSD